MEKLGIGFIGSGFVAGFHAKGFTGVRGAEINAIYNYREESALRLSSNVKALGVGDPKVYTDLHGMLADPSVDAVWMLNPNFKRVETTEVIAEEATQGRTGLVGVCCEKPLARNADEAERMVQLIEKAGLLHGYLENQVYAPTVARGKEVVWEQAARYTGRPYLARAAEEHGARARHMVEAFRAGETPSETWRDGLLVSQLMMTAYLSAEKNTKLDFDPNAVKGYIPKVAKGEWRP